ncbi:HAD family hydrolase [Kribbella sp. CA-293567]|uniref:HAD family hydrolase n=1 Tax=Kribbella sp. CA-293567 TaxID=3002436 RepID=UPI0022DCF357|nr:HAD family hydrolase [Kribbella sp. CA-293567]WBQ05274.1 HAD family hydrolase [Kribbella sp. CA-293567]
MGDRVAERYGGRVPIPEVVRPPRLVATDLDGTLVHSDRSISPRTRAAVLAIQEAGAQFVMVTARPPRWLHELADLVGAHGVAIVANGAILYDVVQRKAIRTALIDPAIGLEIALAIRAAVPEVEFAIERADRYGQEPRYLNRWPTPDDTLVAEVEELLSEPAAKLLVRHPEWHSDELLARVGAVVGTRVTASHSGGHSLVEISASGVSKAAMLAEFAAELGITAAESIAFGDSLNDLPMLAWAGTSYGMGNAHPDVLAMADVVCPTNDEDGVATVLEELFGLD